MRVSGGSPATQGDMELDETVHGVTELRVHGVSGTPPEQMLDQPAELIKRVAGTEKVGFWRRWYPGGSTRDQPDQRHLEAYAWGQLTSGPATRALWLLLLPFTLVNVAHWMLPPYRRHERIGAVSVALLRLLGLTLTMMMLAATATVTMDLAAWQCAPVPRCASRLGPAGLVAGWTPGERLALAAALPGLLVLLLWWLGHVRRHSFAPALPEPAVRKGDCPLADDRFWSGDSSTGRLRSAHITAWCAGLGALTVAPVVRFGGSGPGRGAAVVLLALEAVAVAVAVVATSSNATTSRGGYSAEQYTRPLGTLRKVAMALLVASIAVVLWSPAQYPSGPGYLPDLRIAINTMLVVQGALLTALAGCVATVRPWRLGRTPDGYRVALLGFAAPVMALLAWLVAGALSVGIDVWVSRYLGSTATSRLAAVATLNQRTEQLADPGVPLQTKVALLDERLPLIVPPPFFWAGAAAVIVLGVTLLVAALAVLRARMRTRALVAQVEHQHPGDGRDDPAVRRVAGTWAWASVTDRAGVVLGAMAAAATATMLWGLASYLRADLSLDYRFGLVWLTAPGVTLIAATAAGVVSLGFLAFRNPKVRRTVGILWDVATFWPRANHPLTPPCYGEQAVPALAERVGQLSTGEGDRVILSGHSQGSILVVAAVLQLAEAEASRAALLTYGAPLRRLYARFFPAYFNDEAFTLVLASVDGRWVNLWAESDPIGSWVACHEAGGIDRELTDPLSLARGADGSYAKVCGHSGFLGRPEFPLAVDELAARPTV